MADRGAHRGRRVQGDLRERGRTLPGKKNDEDEKSRRVLTLAGQIQILDPVDPGSNRPKVMETGPIISPILMISQIQIKNAIVIVARKIGETRKMIGQKLFVTDAINRVIMRRNVRNGLKNHRTVIFQAARTMTKPFSKTVLEGADL